MNDVIQFFKDLMKNKQVYLIMESIWFVLTVVIISYVTEKVSQSELFFFCFLFLAFRHNLGDVYKRAQKDVGVIDEEESPEENSGGNENEDAEDENEDEENDNEDERGQENA